MNNSSEHLRQIGIAAPSGNLSRDLKEHKKILLRRGQPCIRVTRAPDMGARVLTFVCSTEGIKRDGNRVRNDPGSWDFTNFAKNPVMLWTHDYGSSERPPMPPIGSWVNWGIEPDGNGNNSLVMSGRFATHDFADLIYNLYLEGHMSAVSIGWTPLEYREIVHDGSFLGWDFFRNELLECSAVPIPADPDAIMVAAQRGLIPASAMERFANWTHPSRGLAYVLDSRDRYQDVSSKQERKENVSMNNVRVTPEIPQVEDPGITCGQCGAVNSSTAQYCLTCGASLMQPETIPAATDPSQEPMVVVEQAMTPCPDCGAEVPSGANYCPSCGASIQMGKASADTSDAPIAGASSKPAIERKSGGATDAGIQSRMMLAHCVQMTDQVKKVMHWCDTMASSARSEEARGGEEDLAAGIISAANIISGLANNILQIMQSIALMVTQPEDDGTEMGTEGAPPTDATDTPATPTLNASLRVGKKIAGPRLSKLQGAHDTIGTGLSELASILKEVIDEGTTASVDPEVAHLRKRIDAMIERKDVLALRRRIELLVDRKDQIKKYAEQILPTAARRT